jgi:NADPH2:quinone reductase
MNLAPMRAWRVHRYGEPTDVLQLDEVEAPTPGPGEVRVAVDAATLNFNDVDGIRGRYRTVDPPLPYIPGMEVLGVVDAAAPDAEGWVGRRVVANPDRCVRAGTRSRSSRRRR